MSLKSKIVLSLIFSLTSSLSFAFSDGSVGLGLGYLAENSFNRITKTSNGQPNALIGTTSFPLLLNYEKSILGDWFIAPSIAYTFFERQTVGSSGKMTLMHLSLPIGKNFSGNMDWYVGAGFMSRTLKGAGGIVNLNNGSGTSDFALPGKTVSSQTITINAGIGGALGEGRLGADLISEGLLSVKRTFSFMLNYTLTVARGLL